nr:endonuclease VII domain-containing protein [Blastococcus sp. PRF04-17]
MEPEKFCPDCGESRPVASFTRDKRRRDGLAFYCREHSRQRLRESKARRHGPPQTRHKLDRVVPEGSKWCPDCDTVKLQAEFPTSKYNKSGRHTYCKPCHNARGRATLERVGGARTYHLKRRYGITAEDANAMLEAQGGLCAICRAAPAVHVDHDHVTGAVRALLCFNCNGGLGQFKDDPAVLRAAADYVQFHILSQRVVALAAAAGLGPVRPIRLGEPPVGSQRRPGTHSTSTRTTGRSSGSRRREQAGEADG